MLIRLHPRTAPDLALSADLALRRVDPGDPAQLWRYDRTGGLAPASGGLAVTAVTGRVDVGMAPLSRTDPAQRWLLGRDLLRHPATGLVLRPEHFVPVPGSRVLLGAATGTDTQHWLSHRVREPGIAKEIS
jgi:hypothetical protein